VDLKLHDIPTPSIRQRSVARHSITADRARLGGSARSGPQSRASEAPDAHLHATVLTSLDAASLGQTWGREVADVEAEVLRLAGLARDGGAVGIVCSGHEAAAARAAYGEQLGLLVPGIRLPGGESHDQRRVMTPVAAAEAGARWLILGRAVTSAADPAATMADVRAALPR
jgi:orotidine-5'-phosphate decarboxylase